ncbi:hypothetical protein GH714_031816 [Hevea brasiliensis]|uniref:G-patch domain-containing protein n=1 Tax=Hevea brasiliensis TaxID=3981 RepID=A0A6A6L3C5_HEVBR|nr:hypothetical protein GH714_031816 [Hevea brasiliensis]
MGVIRGSGRGVAKSDASYSGYPRIVSISAPVTGSSTNADTSAIATPFRTDASALGSYAPPASTGSGKRRFSEMPLSSAAQKEQSQLPTGIAQLKGGVYRDLPFKRGSSDSMPFPPGVGGGRGLEMPMSMLRVMRHNVFSYVTCLSSTVEMGLGKDGSGMIEPVQAQAMENRAGLGSQQKKLDPSLEVQAGDSYKTLIHKGSC